MSKPNQPAPLRLAFTYQVNTMRDDSNRFRAAQHWVATQYGYSSMDVSLAIVDDPTIHELNREHLEHDWPTDVITFVFEQSDDHVEGEIIASADTAARLSQSAGWTPEDELLLYVIHGLLHLAGLDDVEPEDQQKMRHAEYRCLLHLQVPGAEDFLDRWEGVSY